MTGAELEEDFLARYRGLGLEGVGCSREEISILERQYGLTLPASYRGFLRLNGKVPDERFKGSDCGFEYLPELRRWAERLLRENEVQYSLGDTGFVFFMHQGYQFLFFHASESDDPRVWYYLEPEESPRMVSMSFSAWLEEYVSDMDEWKASRSSS